MASLLSYLLFMAFCVFASVLAATPQKHLNISLDASLSLNSTPLSWFSPSGRFAFGFYPEGNRFYVGTWLVASQENATIIWTANRNDAPVSEEASLKLTSQGVKLLVSGSEDVLITPFEASDDDAAGAAVLDSGNVVVYDSSFYTLWESFGSATDTIMGGQTLPSGDSGDGLVSSASESEHGVGRFRLEMQNDGNLVMYPVDTTNTAIDAYWSSGTNGVSYNALNLDTGGRLYLSGQNLSYDLTPTRVTTSNKSSSSALIYRARLNPNGIFRLYSHDLTTNTTTGLLDLPNFKNLCELKGTCGLNSFCTFKSEQPVCLCLPGFSYINATRTEDGCEREFPADSCTQIGDTATLNSMTPLENTVWEDDPYLLSSSKSEEECRDSCLDDCNCDAVLFIAGVCRKQKFPMKYGRRNVKDSSDSKITYIKVGSSRSTTATTQPVAQGPLPLRVSTNRRYIPPLFLIVLVVLAATTFIALPILGFFCYNHPWSWRYRWNRELVLDDEVAPRSFSYRELRDATAGFKEELGKGSFGTVFKGTLPTSRRAVAVKRLEKVADEGEREFRTEMRVIGRTHHKNLVRVLGFCYEGSHRLLVYEFMPNGTLADLIFNPDRSPGWSERARIVLDVARGIQYLHEECEARIIHCDIKPQNILMDEGWAPKISDFGLAKLLMPSQTRTYTGIRGTRGYLAPEWHKNAPVTVKADVYSFGVVLLETVCCRRNMALGVEAPEEIMMLEWVRRCYANGELERLVPGEEVNMWELERMVRVGLWCVQEEPAARPYMKSVAMMVEGHIDVPVPPIPSSVT